jgi:hypothetical protein
MKAIVPVLGRQPAGFADGITEVLIRTGTMYFATVGCTTPLPSMSSSP